MHLPFNIGITSASLSPLSTLTELYIKTNNAYSVEALTKLLSQNSNLKKLTFLVPPWEKLPLKSLESLRLEKLEINELDLKNVLHMTNTLKVLTVSNNAFQCIVYLYLLIDSWKRISGLLSIGRVAG